MVKLCNIPNADVIGDTYSIQQIQCKEQRCDANALLTRNSLSNIPATDNLARRTVFIQERE